MKQASREKAALTLLLAVPPSTALSQEALSRAHQALRQGLPLRVFLMGDGVHHLEGDHLNALEEGGALVVACATSLHQRGLPADDPRGGNQSDLARMVATAGPFLAYTPGRGRSCPPIGETPDLPLNPSTERPVVLILPPPEERGRLMEGLRMAVGLSLMELAAVVLIRGGQVLEISGLLPRAGRSMLHHLVGHGPEPRAAPPGEELQGLLQRACLVIEW